MVNIEEMKYPCIEEEAKNLIMEYRKEV